MSLRMRVLGISLAIVFLVLLGLWGCSAESERTWIIWAILAETGPADFIGEPEAKVLTALRDQYSNNGQWPDNIRLEIRNSEGKPERAVSLFERISQEERVIAVIGPSTSGESIAVAGIADEQGVPLLSLAASKKITLEEDGSTRRWVFKFAQNDDLAAEKLVSTIIGDGHKNVALLYSNDGFGKSGGEVFRTKVADSELLLIHDVAFPPGMSAAEPFVAALPSDVDSVVVWGTAPGPALIVKAMRSMGLQAPIYLSHGNASVDFVRSAGSAVEGATVVGSHVLKDAEYLSDSDPGDAVVQRYRNFWSDNFQGAPSHFGGHARDALAALMLSLEGKDLTVSSVDMRNNIRDSLENLSQFHGVTGSFTFGPNDHAGLTADAFEVYRIESGNFVPKSK